MGGNDFLEMVYYNEVIVKEERIEKLQKLAAQYGLDWVIQNHPELSDADIQAIAGRIF